MSNVVNISLALGTAVATDATMDFPYPAGYAAAADFSQNNEVLVIPSLQVVAAQAADTFTVAYDANSALVTYKGLTTIPAGTLVTLQIEPADSFASPVVAITDGTLGTASNALAEITASYVEATIANSFATLAAKVNELVARVNALAEITDAE